MIECPSLSFKQNASGKSGTGSMPCHAIPLKMGQSAIACSRSAVEIVKNCLWTPSSTHSLPLPLPLLAAGNP